MTADNGKKSEIWIKKDGAWIRAEGEEVKVTGLSSKDEAVTDEEYAQHYGIDYCVGCKRRVQLAKKPFNPAAAILGLMFFGIGLLIYIIYHFLKPKNRCMICKMKLPRW